MSADDGLTETERGDLTVAVHTLADGCACDGVHAAVERILTARRKAVSTNDGLTEQAIREAEQRGRDAETIRMLRAILDNYFDFDVDSWDEGACPEPEDVWRLHRDLRAILTEKETEE